MKKLLATLLAAMFLLGVGLLGTTPAAQAADKGEIKIVYVEWDCATATSYLMKALLEDQGYEVELLPVSAAAMWQALGSGSADAMVCAWLPTTHKTYMEAVKDKLDDLGPNLEGTRIGLVVPKYVTIDSIADLAANGDKFGKRIIGIDPGAGVMALTEQVMKDYGLQDWELVEGSGATMVAALGAAIKRNEWVVVTGWTPHWKFGRWDLKYLEDPKGIYGQSEYIHTIVRKGLDKDAPEAYAVLDAFTWTPDDLSTLMVWNQQEGADLDANARRWIKENPEKVKKWLPKK